MKKEELLRAVRLRMESEGLTQRELASTIGASQGHLSRVLQGRFTRRNRVVRQLERFASRLDPGQSPATPAEDDFVQAARRVARNDAELMRIISRLLQHLATPRTPDGL